MKFELGVDILDFDNGADYPAIRPIKKTQAIDRSAAGLPEVEKLGPDISTRILDFNDMTEHDFLALKNWFVSIADGAVNSFEFTDEKGFVGNVIITSSIYDFKEVDFELYSGSMTLEYV